MQSLEKGNIQSVFIERDGKGTKMFIEANPQFKTITLYDSQMKRMHKEDLSLYQSVKQSQGNEVKGQQKEDMKQDKKKDVKLNTEDDLAGLKKKDLA